MSIMTAIVLNSFSTCISCVKIHTDMEFNENSVVIYSYLFLAVAVHNLLFSICHICISEREEEEKEEKLLGRNIIHYIN